jgi:glycosyltransferase involved in cell wall biosynthesis
MKVLHILGELNPSGAETMLLCAAPVMKAQGLESEILSTGVNVGVFAARLENAGYKIHHLPFKKNLNFFIELYRFIKLNHYDSAHIHIEGASFWVICVLILAGIPAKRCVHTIHNNFRFTGNLRLRRAWQRQWLSLLGVPHIAISKTVQYTESHHFKIKTDLIENWYDSHRFSETTDIEYQSSRQQLQILENQFVIISVGNCSQVKNHSALIKAIAALPKNNIVYLHIGIEADDSERKLAENLGISEITRFMGLQDDIKLFLQAADLYVMPSLREGLSIAALEAIATEIPALLTSVPGLTDFADVFNGLHFCEPDEDSIKMALIKIISTPKDQLKKETKNNAKLAEERFGIDRGVSAYLHYYKGL